MRNVESWNPTLDFLQQKLKVESGSVSSKDPPEIPLKRENHCSGHRERAKGFSREESGPTFRPKAGVWNAHHTGLSQGWGGQEELETSWPVA